MSIRFRPDVREFLRQGAWFGGLSAALQDVILERSVVKRYAQGQVFQHEDGDPIGLVVILEGRVLLLRHTHRESPTLVHVAGPGFWFGEIAVFTGETLVTARAQTKVSALILPTAEFRQLVAAAPRHYAEFARLLCERYRILLRYYVEARAVSADERVRLRLADLAEIHRLDGRSRGQETVLEMSQAELGELLGISRQKVNPRLRTLQKEGWIRVEPRRIVVLDADGLRASVSEHYLRPVPAARMPGVSR